MLERFKVAAIVCGLMLPFLGFIVLAVGLIPEVQEVVVYGLTGFMVLAASVTAFWGLQRQVLSFEVGARLWTHYAMCLLCCLVFVLLSAVLLPLVALGVALGVYFLIYYVLGVVQIPLNIHYVREGYAPFYRPFYPFLSRKRRKHLLFPLRTGEKERFFFSGEGYEGCLEGDFLHMSDDLSKGQIHLNRYFLEIVAPDRPWTPDDQGNAVRKLISVGARTVGYVRREGFKFLLIPDLDRYEETKKLLSGLFKGGEVIPGRIPNLGSLLKRLIGFDPYEGLSLPQASGEENLSTGMSTVFPYDPLRARFLCQLARFSSNSAGPDGLVPVIFRAHFFDREKATEATGFLESAGFSLLAAEPLKVLDRNDEGELFLKENSGGVLEYRFYLPVSVWGGMSREESDLVTAFALYWRMREHPNSSVHKRQRNQIECLLSGLAERGSGLGVFGDETLTLKEMEDKGVFWSEKRGWGCVDPTGAVGEAVRLVRKLWSPKAESVDQMENCVRKFFGICQQNGAFWVDWQ